MDNLKVCSFIATVLFRFICLEASRGGKEKNESLMRAGMDSSEGLIPMN